MSQLRQRVGDSQADQVVSQFEERTKTISKNYPFLKSFVSGIVLGCLVMYIFMVALGAGNSSSQELANLGGSSSQELAKGRSSQELANDEIDDGWHAIHVFYGERSGLGADPKQKSYAQVHQDEVVLDLLGTSGYFIDLAANDALDLTNTLALERYEGWHGLCIEPNPVYWYGLSHRKCTVVGALVGDHVERVDVKFRGVYGGIVGKMDDKMANRKKEPKAEKEKRYTAPLKDVLERYNVPKVIDYMSLDVEGAEYLVMQHFPFDKYQIKVLTVERPGAELKALFEEKGYIFLKDLAWWGETLWAHKSTGFSPEHPKIAKIVTEGK